MLRIAFGTTENEIYDPSTYFIHQYEDEWIMDELSVRMIEDVDRSRVVAPRIIESPVLGMITPRELSGGVKTLMLMAFDETGKVFNASACGDNCAKWIIEIASKKDLTITLHNIMDFGKELKNAYIVNSDKTVYSYSEYLDEAIRFL